MGILKMSNDGWKTKNWTDFTCYSSDGKSALSMEQWKNETWRWCIYGTDQKENWTPAIHCMNQGVFQFDQKGRLLQGDIKSRTLEQSILRSEGEIVEEGHRIARCQTKMRCVKQHDIEFFAISYQYRFESEDTRIIRQEYEVPKVIPFSIQIIPPLEGFNLEWNYASTTATVRLTSRSFSKKNIEFEVLFGILPL